MRSLRDYGAKRSGIPPSSADLLGAMTILASSRRYGLVHLRTFLTFAAIASFIVFLFALRGHDERIRQEGRDACATCKSAQSSAAGLPHTLAYQPKATSREQVRDATELDTSYGTSGNDSLPVSQTAKLHRLQPAPRRLVCGHRQMRLASMCRLRTSQEVPTRR